LPRLGLLVFVAVSPRALLAQLGGSAPSEGWLAR